MTKQDQVLLQAQTVGISSLYDSYAGMLLGYIHEVVKDRKQAEDYLVKIFSDIAKQFDEINWETNTWCQLQRFAKLELAKFNATVEGCATSNSGQNKFLDQMSWEQKEIFCSVYYNKKTTAQLVIELNKPEDVIKKALKEAFAIIRKQHEN